MPVSTPTIKYEKRNRIAYITLNRPEVLNALSRELSAGLREALEDFRDDKDALVAIMTGEGGRAFSAGMDLKERASLDARGERRSPTRRGGGTFIDLEVFKPIIAAIDGYCVAGGLELSLQCDMRIATAKSEFGLPEPRWSLTAGYGLHNLSRMIPLGEALSMQLRGHRINSERAYQIGLIQEIVPDRETLFERAEAYAEEVKLCAPRAVQAIKQIVYYGRNLPVEYSQKIAGPLNAWVQSSPDSVEGPKAFSEKRAPVWQSG